MATIINFTAKRNERIAVAEESKRAEARQFLIDKHMNGAKEAAANGDVKAMMECVNEAVTVQENIERPMPAYCDPRNKFEGSKYRRGLSTKEVAAAVREDIKLAKKHGTLPGALKVSVKYDRFSGGSSISVKIVDLPEETGVYSVEYLEATENLTKMAPYNNWLETYTAEVRSYLDTLEEIVVAYKMDNSDSMSDYFHVNFYHSVTISYDLERG